MPFHNTHKKRRHLPSEKLHLPLSVFFLCLAACGLVNIWMYIAMNPSPNPPLLHPDPLPAGAPSVRGLRVPSLALPRAHSSEFQHGIYFAPNLNSMKVQPASSRPSWSIRIYLTNKPFDKKSWVPARDSLEWKKYPIQNLDCSLVPYPCQVMADPFTMCVDKQINAPCTFTTEALNKVWYMFVEIKGVTNECTKPSHPVRVPEWRAKVDRSCGYPNKKKSVANVEEGGYIVALKSTDDMNHWSTVGISLMLKDNHLSYPQIFYDNGEYWMLPQVNNAGGMHLWKTNAYHFPLGWEYVQSIGNPTELYSDASYYKKGENEHYIFTSNAGADTDGEAVHVWYAASVLGPWMEHPQSPLTGATQRHFNKATFKKKTRRPGGRPFVYGKILYVPCQTSQEGYGAGLVALAIRTLSFAVIEQLSAILIDVQSSKDEWKTKGAHHFVVDKIWGFKYQYAIVVNGRGHLDDPTVQLGVYSRTDG